MITDAQQPLSNCYNPDDYEVNGPMQPTLRYLHFYRAIAFSAGCKGVTHAAMPYCLVVADANPTWSADYASLLQITQWPRRSVSLEHAIFRNRPLWYPEDVVKL